MNQTETKAFNWLIAQGIAEGEIVYQPRKSPDFLIRDGGMAYEIKKLQGNMILIYPQQWEAIKDFPNLVILVFDDGDAPVYIIPIQDLTDCPRYWGTLHIHFVPPMGEWETIIYRRKIPNDLSHKAKAQAALEGKTLSAWIAEMVKEKLKKEERK